MTRRITALALAAAALATPALAMGEGGCNWGAASLSASADPIAQPVLSTPVEDARS